jgi:hypothetical protein
MVEILCPHCEEEITLDDSAFGEFECPHCENEFEWGEAPKTRPRSAGEGASNGPMSGVVALSHAVHALGVLLLIIGLFSDWVVILGGIIGFGPFGMSLNYFGESATIGWFEMFTNLEGEMIAATIAGMLFMVLAIIAVISQIIHVAFRIMLHMTESGGLEISMEMAYRVYNYRWITSLTALVCSVAGYLLVQIGTLVSLGGEVGFPRPSLFVVLLIGVLGGQVYLMHQERLMEQ